MDYYRAGPGVFGPGRLPYMGTGSRDGRTGRAGPFSIQHVGPEARHYSVWSGRAVSCRAKNGVRPSTNTGLTQHEGKKIGIWGLGFEFLTIPII